MAILLTGGTGKTSTRLASLLHEASISFLLASRSASSTSTSTISPYSAPAVKFDWLDPSTFENPFQHKFPNGERISSVYLVSPPVDDPAPSMIEFIDLAVKKHEVKRFVLLTGSSSEIGGRGVGKVWEHLIELGVEYCVLRATWFMENFSEHFNLVEIRDEGKIYTACGDGKIPFISAGDIAAVAFRALTDSKSHNTEYRILGPELLTYDEIAAKLSKGLGRHIMHVKLSEEEKVQRFMSAGMPEHYAKFLAGIEAGSAKGMEERENDAVERLTGKPAQRFGDWVQQNKTAWD